MTVVRWWGLGFAFLLVLAGCEPSTQLLVIVDSDLGSELAAVHVSASAEGTITANRRFEIATTGLPFSFGVAPEGAEEQSVGLRISGLAQDGTELVSHAVETRFLPGRTLRLEVPLAQACLLEHCAESELRCVYGACADRFVDPTTLAEGSAAPEGLFDGSTERPDAGALVPDAGCEAAAPCVDPLNPCRVGAMLCDGDAPVCEILETLPEGAECGEGRLCDGAGRCGG